jgi:hypothetical protein
LSSIEDWSTRIDPIEKIWSEEIGKWIDDSDGLSYYANKSVERAQVFSDSSCLKKILDIIKLNE